MSDYFAAADPAGILRDYPLGKGFLAGPARLSRDELEALRERRFLSLIARAWQVPFYQRRWAAVGLEPADIAAIEDIVKIPPYSKTDLIESIERHPPFGDFHGLDMSDPARSNVVLHTTSGTTGEPQPLFFGPRDREVQNALLARTYLLQGLKASDVVHATYGFGMVNGGHYIREAVLHFTKALLLPAGTGAETASVQQVRLMQRFGATVLVGFTDFLKRLAEVAGEIGLEPGRELPIRMISGHLGTEDREILARAWGGAAVFDWYGVGDTGVIAAEGPDRDGLIVWEDAHMVEILDPVQGSEMAAGQAGEICVTSLFKRDVYPIVRFNTHDVSAWLPDRFDDTIGFRRIAGFQGRTDSMVKLRGINVYPTAIGDLLAAQDKLNGEFVCLVENVDGRDEMTVKAETRLAMEAADRSLRQATADHLRQQIGVSITVELTPPGGTAAESQIESRQKPLRLIDRRGTNPAS